MFRELGRLRHDYKTVDAELRSAQQQLIVQRGEIELARAGFIETAATDDRVAAVSTTVNENYESPAKMTERERDLVLRTERLTSHTRALELNADRLRAELRQATVDHEMTKGDLRAAQTNIRALEAQVSALSLRQSPLPKVCSIRNKNIFGFFVGKK
jgi:phage shock protein A